MAECDWVILCDYAFPAMGGKLCMIGIFEMIFSKEVPTTHPRASIGFAIIGEPGESVAMKLDIIGPTAEVLKNFQLSFVLPDAGTAFGHIELQNLILKDWGRHAIEVDLGDGATKSAWFTLTQIRV